MAFMGNIYETGNNRGRGFEEQTLDAIASSLQQNGYIVLTDVFNENLLKNLYHQSQMLAVDNWKPAGIGRDQGHHLNSRVRSDHIHWIGTDDPAELDFLSWMEILRTGLNLRLFMGLSDFEAHFSKYPVGAFYQKHIDALKGRSNRILSSVLYLNDNWRKEDAGELLLYSEKGRKPIKTIAPKFGNFVLFLSEDFPHEVLQTHRPRFSIAGWFRGLESL